MQQLFAQLEAIQPLPEELQSLLKATIHTKNMNRNDFFSENIHGAWVFIEKGFLGQEIYSYKGSSWLFCRYLEEGQNTILKVFPESRYKLTARLLAIEPSIIYYLTLEDRVHISEKFPVFSHQIAELLTQDIASIEKYRLIFQQPLDERLEYVKTLHPSLLRSDPARLTNHRQLPDKYMRDLIKLSRLETKFIER